jgi:uncharacterized protein YnzC (UPF0291/DUF896 family)
MAEKLVYYLLALTLAGGFFLVYGIVATELRSKRESQDRQKLRAAYSDIKRLHASESTEQQAAVEEAGRDSEDGITLDLIKQLQQELNQRVIELEREL